MAKVSRDCFAREEVHRRNIFTATSCDFCGSYRYTKRHRSYLYEYRIETDGGSKNTIRGLFCSVGCMRAYHGH